MVSPCACPLRLGRAGQGRRGLAEGKQCPVGGSDPSARCGGRKVQDLKRDAKSRPAPRLPLLCQRDGHVPRRRCLRRPLREKRTGPGRGVAAFAELGGAAPDVRGRLGQGAGERVRRAEMSADGAGPAAPRTRTQSKTPPAEGGVGAEPGSAQTAEGRWAGRSCGARARRRGKGRGLGGARKAGLRERGTSVNRGAAV